MTWNNCLLGSLDIANNHQPIRATCLHQAIVDYLWLKLLPDRNQNTGTRWADAQADLNQYFTSAWDSGHVCEVAHGYPVSIVVTVDDDVTVLPNWLEKLIAPNNLSQSLYAS